MSLQNPGASNDDPSGAAPLMNDDTHTDASNSLGVSLEDNIPLDLSKLTGNKHSGSLVLVLVVSIAAAALWGMRQMGTSGSLSFANGPEIDYPIDDLTSKLSTNTHQYIMTKLESSGDIAQIPLDDVLLNPFQWNMVINDDTKTPTTTKIKPLVDPVVAARLERERKIQSEFAMLRLNSVIGGSMPVARISGALVRIGDPVGEFFTVVRISTREVMLTADAEEFLLSMDQ